MLGASGSAASGGGGEEEEDPPEWDGKTAHYVRQGASGTGSGNDWTNAYTSLPSSLTRDHVYYIADGSYSGYTFDDANDGTKIVYIVKATESDHGTDTGWDSAYGDGTAAFTGAWRFTTDYWTVDGVTGGGPGDWGGTPQWDSAYGFQITETDASTPAVSFGNNQGTDADFVTLRHFKTIGMANGNSNGGTAANDALAFYPGSGNNRVSYAWLHEAGRCPIFMPPSTGETLLEYLYITRFWADLDPHGETAAIDNPSAQITIRWSLITWTASTGGIQFGMDSEVQASLHVYGCVFYMKGDGNMHGNGYVLGSWDAGHPHNVFFYNNTVIDGIDPVFYSQGDGHDYNVSNNLFYNSDDPGYSGDMDHDYNHYINTGGTHSESNGTSAASGDPFEDYESHDFRTTSNTTAGTNLGSPYNVDMYGRTRSTWTRGAIEYATTAP